MKFNGKKYKYGHPNFYRTLIKMANIHESKNHDYSFGQDPLKNFRKSEACGIPPWKGCLIRIEDKIARLESFARTEEFKVKNESIIDTLEDLANYAILCKLLYQEKSKKKK